MRVQVLQEELDLKVVSEPSIAPAVACLTQAEIQRQAAINRGRAAPGIIELNIVGRNLSLLMLVLFPVFLLEGKKFKF